MGDSAGVTELELWETHAAELVRYATLLVGPADASDVVSVAFGKLRATAQQVLHPRRFLLRVVTNVALDQLRSAKRRQRRDLLAALPPLVAEHESHVDIRRAVADLEVDERAVVYFTYWEDLDPVAIAELLGVNPGTVRRRLVRARTRLRKVLS
ncbi:MAG: RNA polymerase sigma factor [Ilumatobacteraceae bacterium]